MSGNGLRCLVHAAIDAGAVRAGPGDSLSVLTPAGPAPGARPGLRRGLDVGQHGDGDAEGHRAPGRAATSGTASCASTWVTRTWWCSARAPRRVDVAGLGPALSRRWARATGGVNVEFVALGPGRDELTMRVWERGVGETLACGTGSVAAAAALHHWGRVGTKVTVNQPGGAAEVELRPDGAALLSGPEPAGGHVRVGRPGQAR